MGEGPAMEEAIEVLGQGAGVGIPILERDGQAPGDDRLEGVRDGRIGPPHGDVEQRPAVEQDAHRAGGREGLGRQVGRLAGQELAQDQPERIDVGRGADLAPEIGIEERLDLLGGHVGQRTAVHRGLGLRRGMRRLGQVEVEELRAVLER